MMNWSGFASKVLTGALERTAGTGSAQRISRKLDGDHPGTVTDGA